SASDGPRQALRMSAENIASVGMLYGIPSVTYEAGVQWNVVNQSAVNMGATIMDTSGAYQTALEAYYQGISNSPFLLLTHTTGGVSSGNSATSPELEFTTDYDALSSAPTLLALQSFTGLTPQRNVVSGPGATIDCINYTDNDSVINGTYPYLGQNSAFSTGPHYGTAGYLTYSLYSPVAQTRSLSLTLNAAATGATDVE